MMTLTETSEESIVFHVRVLHGRIYGMRFRNGQPIHNTLSKLNCVSHLDRLNLDATESLPLEP
jgi:hypothetical protein